VRSETDLLPGDVFEVAEELPGMNGVLFLKMADGTGWVFDQKPGRGVMCVREERAQALASSLTKWRYISVSGDPISIRLTPDVEGVRSETDLLPGDVFEVAEELPGMNGVLFLKMADGTGWVFDQKPGRGVKGVREEHAQAPPLAPSSSRKTNAGK